MNLRIACFCIFAALGGALFGYDIGVISSCYQMPNFIARFGTANGDGTYTLSAGRQSLITSLLSAGTFAGSLLQSYTASLRSGRKGAIFGWSLLFTVACIVQVSSKAYKQLLAGRFLAGLGVGALSALIPLYNGEVAPKAVRGTMLVLYQVMISFGLALAYGIDLGTHAIDGPASWQVPVGFQLVFGVTLCTGVWFLPESPRLLLAQGNVEAARRNVAKMNGCSPKGDLVTEEILDLQAMLELENEGGKAGWLELLSTNHGMWRRTLNACMIQTCQQLRGQNFLYYYGPTFFQQARLKSITTFEIQFILGMVTFIFVMPSMYLIERLGRRKMLIIGGCGEFCCAMISGFVGHFLLAPSGTPDADLTPTNTKAGQVLVAFSIISIAFYADFWGATPWVVTGETFPLRVRAKGIAAATATNWLWNFLLGFFSEKIANDIGPLILLVFAGVILFGQFYVYFCLPETKGLSLEEVDQIYTLHVKPWRSSGWKPPVREHQSDPENMTAEEKLQYEHRERASRAAAKVSAGH